MVYVCASQFSFEAPWNNEIRPITAYQELHVWLKCTRIFFHFSEKYINISCIQCRYLSSPNVSANDPCRESANDPCRESANSLGTGKAKFISVEQDDSRRKSGNGEMEPMFGIIEGDSCCCCCSCAAHMSNQFIKKTKIFLFFFML